MAEKEGKLLGDFENKIEQLVLFCNSLKEENKRLKKEALESNKEIEFLRLSMEKLNLKYANLKIAKSLTSEDSEAVSDAKKRLSRLVRDVDKCIALLKR